jgi:hypothetical protein
MTFAIEEVLLNTLRMNNRNVVSISSMRYRLGMQVPKYLQSLLLDMMGIFLAGLPNLKSPSPWPHYKKKIFFLYTNTNVCPAVISSVKHKHTNKKLDL